MAFIIFNCVYEFKLRVVTRVLALSFWFWVVTGLTSLCHRSNRLAYVHSAMQTGSCAMQTGLTA